MSTIPALRLPHGGQRAVSASVGTERKPSSQTTESTPDIHPRTQARQAFAHYREILGLDGFEVRIDPKCDYPKRKSPFNKDVAECDMRPGRFPFTRPSLRVEPGRKLRVLLLSAPRDLTPIHYDIETGKDGHTNATLTIFTRDGKPKQYSFLDGKPLGKSDVRSYGALINKPFDGKGLYTELARIEGSPHWRDPSL